MVSVNPYAALSAASQPSKDRVGIADNFDTFLTLLTTQLKNQNPLDPLDTNQFTQQLVEFTGVEQALKTNENLELLTQLMTVGAVNSAVGYIGKEVSVSGATANFDGVSASWRFNSPAATETATFVVRDAAGAEVWREARGIAEGAGAFSWNGNKLGGGNAPQGTYSLTIAATDAADAPLAVKTSYSGIVEAVDLSGAAPTLTIGGQTVGFDQIIGIRNPS
jgi:flagellar basal-body rod modification protein FlgD